jgi:hypothetical protein
MAEATSAMGTSLARSAGSRMAVGSCDMVDPSLGSAIPS